MKSLVASRWYLFSSGTFEKINICTQEFFGYAKDGKGKGKGLLLVTPQGAFQN